MSAREGSRTAVGLSLLALAAGLAALVLALGPSRRDGPRPSPAASLGAPAAPPPSEELARRVEELERRLALLEGRPARGAAAPSAELLELAARVAALEAAPHAGKPELPPPIPEGAEELLAAIRAHEAERPHESTGVERTHAFHRRRAELLEAFLERHAAHPAAPKMLEELVRACYGFGDFGAVELALDRFAPRVALEPWRIDDLYGNCFSNQRRFDEARERRARVRDDPALPETVRADAHFWFAHTLEKEGRLEDAIDEYERMIAAHASSGNAVTQESVAGARSRIEQVRRWIERRDERR
jgi:tetratricopeptide (TPR) repeat protein